MNSTLELHLALKNDVNRAFAPHRCEVIADTHSSKQGKSFYAVGMNHSRVADLTHTGKRWVVEVNNKRITRVRLADIVADVVAEYPKLAA